MIHFNGYNIVDEIDDGPETISIECYYNTHVSRDKKIRKLKGAARYPIIPEDLRDIIQNKKYMYVYFMFNGDIETVTAYINEDNIWRETNELGSKQDLHCFENNILNRW